MATMLAEKQIEIEIATEIVDLDLKNPEDHQNHQELRDELANAFQIVADNQQQDNDNSRLTSQGVIILESYFKDNGSISRLARNLNASGTIISRSHISRIINGKSSCKIDLASKIVDQFTNVSIEDLRQYIINRKQ